MLHSFQYMGVVSMTARGRWLGETFDSLAFFLVTSCLYSPVMILIAMSIPSILYYALTTHPVTCAFHRLLIKLEICFPYSVVEQQKKRTIIQPWVYGDCSRPQSKTVAHTLIPTNQPVPYTEQKKQQVNYSNEKALCNYKDDLHTTANKIWKALHPNL